MARTDKTGRELFWLLCLLASILPGVTSYSNDDSIYSETCSSQECINIAATVRGTMNSRVNPCDDFYEFACGGNLFQLDAHSTIEQSKIIKYHEALILKRNSSSRSMRLAANFYDKCLAQDNEADMAAFNDLITQFDNDYSNSSSEELIRFAMLEGRDTIFGIGFDTYKNELRLTYTIEPLLPKTFETIIGFVTSTEHDDAELLSSRPSLLEFTTKLSKLSEKAAQVPSSSIEDYMTLQELDHFSPNINWSTILGSSNDQNTTILLNAPRSWLSDLNVLVGDTDVDIMKRFSGVRILIYYAAIVNRHEIMKDWYIPEQFCVKLVVKTFPRITQAIFAEKYILPSSIGTVEFIVEEIRSSFIDLQSPNKNYGKESQNNVIERVCEIIMINSVKTLLGYMKESLNTLDNDEEWKEVADIAESLSFVDLKRKIARVSVLKSINQTEQHFTDDIFDSIGELEMSNLLAIHTIVVPPRYLQSPLFEPNGPLFYLYGLMGSMIGHEFMHSLIDDGVVFENNQTARNENSQTFQEQTEECFVNQYDNYTVDEGRFRVNGSYTLIENMADNGGLAASYHAYMKRIEMYRHDQSILGLHHYSPEQMFFLSYAQFYCPHQTTFDPTDVHAPNKVRVRGVASNSHEFSKAFKCPMGSPMNPIKKCNVWPMSSSSCFINMMILFVFMLSFS